MIGDLDRELETWKEVALFAVLDLIMTTSPYKRFIYSPCPSLRIRKRDSQHLLFTIKQEKLQRTVVSGLPTWTDGSIPPVWGAMGQPLHTLLAGGGGGDG
jgi:hypothetical protein